VANVTIIDILLILHFLGLAMGFAASFSGMVMMGLMGRATPQERPVLARVPPAMTRVGDVGLLLLWASGLILLFYKWGGFAAVPWQFHAKFTVVILLTLLIGYMHSLMAKARRGDTAAAARMPTMGKIAFTLAVTAVVLAVLAFH
jgi:hypothetical protein